MIDQDSDLHPLFCRRGLLVGANGGAVDHLDVAVIRGGDLVHQPVPHTCLSPSHEAVVAGGAWPIAFRQVAPWRAGAQHPENAVQHASVVHAGHASRLVGQQRLDHAPLEVGQVVSAHADAESRLSRRRKFIQAIYDRERRSTAAEHIHARAAGHKPIVSYRPKHILPSLRLEPRKTRSVHAVGEMF